MASSTSSSRVIENRNDDHDEDPVAILSESVTGTDRPTVEQDGNEQSTLDFRIDDEAKESEQPPKSSIQTRVEELIASLPDLSFMLSTTLQGDDQAENAEV